MFATPEQRDGGDRRHVHLNAFDMSCVVHQSPGLWRHPDNQAWRYADLDYWTSLARTLERGGFDAVFIADVLGVYDVYGGNVDAALRQGTQIPLNEPTLAIPAMAAATGHLAADRARPLRFGLRLHVIARERAEDAWDEARRMLEGMDPDAIAAAQARYARMDSVGQRRMTALAEEADLVVAPNLWAGIGLVREGAGTALVGSYGEVAERLREYHALGFDEFILSGYPHLEEAYRVGEQVLPLV